MPTTKIIKGAVNVTIENHDKKSVKAIISKAQKDFEGTLLCEVETDKNTSNSQQEIFFFEGHLHDLVLEVYTIDGKKSRDFKHGESLRIDCKANTSSNDNTISIEHNDEKLDIFNTKGELKIKWSIREFFHFKLKKFLLKYPIITKYISRFLLSK